MNKTKKWLVTAVVLIAFGALLFGVTFLAAGCDFTKFNTMNYITQTHEIKEEFKAIGVEVETADVVFAVAEDGKAKVVCHENVKVQHSVFVEDGVLMVKAADEREWYDYVGIGMAQEKVTVYLPQTAYGVVAVTGSTGDVQIPKEFTFSRMRIQLSTGDVYCNASVAGAVTIEATTGDITMRNISVGSLNLTVSTGRIHLSSVVCEEGIKVTTSTGDADLTDVACGSLTSTGSTGDVDLENVLVKGMMSIERDTGDVEFEKCDAAEIYVETSTGDVEGSFLTGKSFFGESSTGKRRLPQTTGGKCEINTSTGDVEITIVND